MQTEYVVEVDTNSRKTILGFDCHKVVLKKKTEPEELDLPIALNFGDEVFEMFVTDKVALPAHALIFFNQAFLDFFPLEIKSYGTKFPGLYEIFEAKVLKIKK